MDDFAGPVGYQHIETAPKDGSWLRFLFRRVEYEGDGIGRWEPHAEMKTGGSWFDRNGCYITPGPLFWAPALPNNDQDSEQHRILLITKTIEKFRRDVMPALVDALRWHGGLLSVFC